MCGRGIDAYLFLWFLLYLELLTHILIDCGDVVDVRQTFYNSSDLFTNVADDTILKILKEINLYTDTKI